ncbi:hypothetical protein H8B06_18665 [Sphingobacterium sp. DN00404]|uniref:Uncharacterized protein n=1 Tax=Sphingobacterium micropteri TaxID=2763501 RepID=A0ABR7YU22_9SPHI|nr:hypothetical protein [Sphingobacterium micropteri]MBD1434853.1 hypothetical protein [Sphingobacterium micropteri]
MAKQNKEQVVYYHERSEKIFRDKMPKIAELVNSLKPQIKKFEFEGVAFTEIALPLLKGNFEKVDDLIGKAAKEKSQNIAYLEDMIKRDYNEVKRIVVDYVNEINRQLNVISSTIHTKDHYYTTLDNDACLAPEFLSVDNENDLFICDEDAVNRVKPRFEIRLEGKGLEFYNALTRISELLNETKNRGEEIGFDPFYFKPMSFIAENEDETSYEVDIIALWEDLKSVEFKARYDETRRKSLAAL